MHLQPVSGLRPVIHFQILRPRLVPTHFSIVASLSRFRYRRLLDEDRDYRAGNMGRQRKGPGAFSLRLGSYCALFFLDNCIREIRKDVSAWLFSSFDHSLSFDEKIAII
ncbi:hypothetical protein GWI33_020828 [Rhynchophorus ferrugineus]|uniref:Uncharacterized protein n=1 Tax=Rhynchophorus ferrugineus TaxID=354439 RepID=A0A834HNR8_RHYFE|nr:hypothetical protein GWI33_020828 [Rhynchophorus ferrugineus]